MQSHFLSIVTVVILATAASQSIRLNFVKGVNTNEFTDYYFSCNVMGRFIQWQYNKERLTGFHSNDEIGASKVLEKADFIYTALLLLSEPLTTHNRTMASIILVSFMGPVPSSFNITCSSGSLCQTVRAGPVSNVSRSQASTSGKSSPHRGLGGGGG